MQYLLLALLATTSPDMCVFMSGAGVQVAAPFEEAGKLAQAGDFATAFDAFWKESGALSAQVEATFYNGKVEDMKTSRDFIDRNVKADKAPLEIRKDRLTLPVESWAWGAWAACKAGNGDKGLLLLKSGWRDWADRKLRADAAFLLMALGRDAEAEPFLGVTEGQEPSAARGLEMIAQGAWLCRSGKKEDGKGWLDKAMAEVLDRCVREALPALAAACGPQGK